MNDPFVGSLTFCRIYSGILEQGSSLLNSVKDKRERVGRMLLMHSNSREDIKDRVCRRYRSNCRPEGNDNGRYAL